MTMGVHHADTLNYFFGPVKSAFAYFKKLYIPAPVEDVNVVVFQFESGVLGYIGCNYATRKQAGSTFTGPKPISSATSLSRTFPSTNTSRSGRWSINIPS